MLAPQQHAPSPHHSTVPSSKPPSINPAASNPSRPMLFVPRQVALAAASSQPRAAASAMAKEEPKKEKRSKRKAAANGGAAVAVAPGARAAVVASVAAFLESAGLPRTLAALQSEAGLEVTALVTLSPVLCVCGVAVSGRCLLLMRRIGEFLVPGRRVWDVAGELGGAGCQILGVEVLNPINIYLCQLSHCFVW